MTDTKKISELESLTILAADDILTLVDFDALVTKRMSTANFFGNIPTGVNFGLGIAVDDHYGLMQLWNTGSPTAGWSCGGMYPAVVFNPATDANNDAYGVNATIRTAAAPPVGGYPTSEITGVRGYANNPTAANTELDKIFGGSFEGRQYGADVGEIYAVMAQATNLSVVSGDTTRITGVYADAYTSISTGAVAVGTLYGAELRTFGKTNVAGATSAVTTAYGLFSSVYCQQQAGSTSTIGTAYNIYLTDLRPGGGITYGPVTTYYGLFIKEATKAATNWAIYSEGRHHFDQPTADAAIPVLTLDQADISEGLINFVASDRGVIAGATASDVSVRVELDGVVYRLALYADA